MMQDLGIIQEWKWKNLKAKMQKELKVIGHGGGGGTYVQSI